MRVQTVLSIVFMTAVAAGGSSRLADLPGSRSGSAAEALHAGEGRADVLFVFAAYSSEEEFAWGRYYWNPGDEQFPSGWSYDTVQPATVEPDGSPYHWNGGLGSAMDALGVSWEWYATMDGSGAQVLPDAGTLSGYGAVFVHTFDYWWSTAPALTPGAVDVLSDYMDAGGSVVLVGQDLHLSGVSGGWLDGYFGTGAIGDDVYQEMETLTAQGTGGSFMEGWSGTADRDRFTDANAFWPDAVSGSACIGDGTYFFSSERSAGRSVFSSFELECCSPPEVEQAALIICYYVGVISSLEEDTWGAIKGRFNCGVVEGGP